MTSQTIAAPASGAEHDVYSQGARLQPGSFARLIDIPSIEVGVTCSDQKADISVTNKAATADAVVSSYEGHTIQPVLESNRPLVVPIEIPDIQTWTIAPFSGGEYRPTTVTIGVRAVEPGSTYACGAMAQAVMGEKVGSITK